MATSMNSEESKKSILRGEESRVEPKLLHRVFEENLIKNNFGEKTALIFEDENVPKRLTKYNELNENANRMANVILETIGSESSQDTERTIAVCMKISDELVTVLLAVWKAGAAYMSIGFGFPHHRMEQVLEDVKPALIIFSDDCENSKYFSAIPAILYSDLKKKSESTSNENIPEKATTSSTAMVLYTSGSTGVPRGVKLTHRTIHHRIHWQLKAFPYGESEDCCVFKSNASVDHFPELWTPLIEGKSLVIVPRKVLINPELFVPLLENNKIQRLSGVPTLLRMILTYLKMEDKVMLPSLRMMISSGETLTLKLVHEFFEHFVCHKHLLVNLYGSTEVSADVSFYIIKSKNQVELPHKISIGTPIDNTILYVLDNDMKPVKEGEIGEIYCAGANIYNDYINNHDSHVFMENPMEKQEPFNRIFKTGDFGMIKDNLLYFEGRHDSQIKIRGNRVDIAEVEKNLEDLDYVDKAVVVVYHINKDDQALLGFVTLKNSVSKQPLDIEKDLKTHMSDYMIPKITVIDEFPYLPSGKVDGQRLLTYQTSPLAMPPAPQKDGTKDDSHESFDKQ